MIEAFEFPLRDAAAAWRSFKLNVDQSPLMFTLRIWLPLTAQDSQSVRTDHQRGHRLESVCLCTRWLSDDVASLAACARVDQSV